MEKPSYKFVVALPGIVLTEHQQEALSRDISQVVMTHLAMIDTGGKITTAPLYPNPDDESPQFGRPHSNVLRASRWFINGIVAFQPAILKSLRGIGGEEAFVQNLVHVEARAGIE